MNDKLTEAERMLHQIAELSHEELKSLAKIIASDPKKIKALEVLQGGDN
ncbi:hypothetical protein HY969_02625 [Candidatus Kaiserbacteria bacterium]|nr:hypothetical protein [Candidatus Kaiserbacteria bacterium]